MLSDSVGKNASNQSGDVSTIQQIFNLRDDLRVNVPKLIVDGKYGPKTQAAIDLMQSKYMKNPDGRIDPYGFTLQKIWPATYGKPTGLGVRKSDAYGGGSHGSSRGIRKHDGTDYISIPGHTVKSPLSGRVIKISKPYSSGIDAAILSGVEIEASDGSRCWVWYMQPSQGIVGKVVRAGASAIGVAKTLKNRYKNGITDHVHVRIHQRNGAQLNPVTVIR